VAPVKVERYIPPAYRARCSTRPEEPLIAELARRQHGVVARFQLLDAGFSTSSIARRIQSGRLHRVHPGVYAVGHPVLGPCGRWRAATLAGGRDARLGLRSAGALWGLRQYSGPHDVIVSSARRDTSSLNFHRIRLAADETTTEDGIPVTTVARTLLDLAGVLDRHRLAQVVAAAERRRLADSPSLPELAARHRGARGLAALREILTNARLGSDVTESELEIAFAAFVAERGLAAPELNVWVEAGGRSYRLDCLWRDAGLAVELDSRAHHHDPVAFEADRARDAALLAIGVRTMRVTARRLRADGDRLEGELRSAVG